MVRLSKRVLLETLEVTWLKMLQQKTARQQWKLSFGWILRKTQVVRKTHAHIFSVYKSSISMEHISQWQTCFLFQPSISVSLVSPPRRPSVFISPLILCPSSFPHFQSLRFSHASHNLVFSSFYLNFPMGYLQKRPFHCWLTPWKQQMLWSVFSGSESSVVLTFISQQLWIYTISVNEEFLHNWQDYR